MYMTAAICYVPVSTPRRLKHIKALVNYGAAFKDRTVVLIFHPEQFVSYTGSKEYVIRAIPAIAI